MLAYSDVVLVPKYSTVRSRSEIDTTTKLGKYQFAVPLMPANMVCCIDEYTATILATNNIFYSMHRFMPYNELKQFILNMNRRSLLTSISLGVKQHDKDFIDEIIKDKLKVDFITIDIAHGHSILMKEMVEYINDAFKKKNRPMLIAGNVSTKQAGYDLTTWGVDVIKAGIAQGAACITLDKTGYTNKMFSTILDVKSGIDEALLSSPKSTKVYLIADGGIKCNADVSKAIVAGADMVMAGSWFAKLHSSPAKIVRKSTAEPVLYKANLGGVITDDIKYVSVDKIYKSYYGSASAHNKTVAKNIEGTLIEIPYDKRTYIEALDELKEDIQSAISYGGGTKLLHLRNVSYNTYK